MTLFDQKMLCIYTHNLKFFYEALNLFKKEKMKYKALDSFEDFPPHECLILTTVEDVEKIKPIAQKNVEILPIVPEEYEMDEILLTTIQHLYKIKTPNKVTVAIDPGEEKLAIAVFLGDFPIYTREMIQIREMVDIIRNCYHLYPNSTKSLKIGEGNFFLTVKYLDILKKEGLVHGEIEIQLIDEYRTSQKSSFEKNQFQKILKRRKSVHEKSAILIGQRIGKKFFITKEEIKEEREGYLD